MHLNLSSLNRIDAAKADTDVVRKVSGMSVFAGMDPTSVASIVSEAEMRHFPSGTVVISEGDESNGEAYVIISGKAEVFIEAEVVSVLGEGGVF